MLALALSAALALNPPAPYPDGFVALCIPEEESSTWVTPQFSHIRAPWQRLGTSTHMNVEIAHERGQFTVMTRGADLEIGASNGKDWTLDVLKQESGDLVLSLKALTMGASISIYHLRYQGAAGMLAVTRTDYYGPGAGEASLITMKCSIGTRPVRH